MSELDTRDVLERVRVTVRDVHEGLLTWVDRTLAKAGLEGVQTSSDFPPEGRTAPTLVIFPYRFGPDPNLHSTARACSLLGLGPDYRPGSVGLPEPWSQMGAMLTEALLGVWPGARRSPGQGPALRHTVPISELPGHLQSWYQNATPRWADQVNGVDAATLPFLWYVPGLSVTVSYLVSGGAASRGALAGDLEATPLLLSALSAVVTVIHHEGGFDLSLVPQSADKELPGFVSAVAATVRALSGPTDLADCLDEAAKTLTARHRMNVSVLLTQELGSGELFNLMQALHRPFKAAFCLRVSMRLADALLFGPSAGTATQISRFVYEVPPDPQPEPSDTPAPDARIIERRRP